ncbi:unnamed protein product [Aphanomyces euteiches]|uniref:Uncharacterized protein n=1 Tax=Aphanomyces euteiches TaxID=100861 RepID=A0A6G0WSC7_9STRA|nr:hypothetical protein Ae201684_012328 [Aphanomyces euteiches]KAH9096504.1 hypothetical protein Ae201684P_013172 [Aphanomyces euteiches]KAH9157227.1 hypothetical protein AeRB84_000902 [Aphanomyces euteiches]
MAPTSKRDKDAWEPPDHWDDVDRLGGFIPMGASEDTRGKLVAARVPLDRKYVLPEERAWSPKHLLESCRERNMNVHLVIDLTNTFKYYNGKAEFEPYGIEYVKMRVEGFADVPNEDIVHRFIDVMSKWEKTLQEASDDDEDSTSLTPVAIVHCTHGLNRTGYLIVRYLIAIKGLTVKEALDVFSAARPPGLIKHMYIRTLYEMFNQTADMVLPELPEWAQNKYDRSKEALRTDDKFRDSKRQRVNETKRKPPENWSRPPRMGNIVVDSPFLPMRTPLNKSFDHGNDPWTPEIFATEQTLQGHRVKLVVDLTNTKKYYDGPSCFPDWEYKKFPLDGFHGAPSRNCVNKFLDLVKDFESTHPDGHLALHCTHGLNRTGFLVACYLIQRKNYSVQAAVDAFTDARPPGIIKHAYIDELFRRYANAADARIVYPVLPGWAMKKYGKRDLNLLPPPAHWLEREPHGKWIKSETVHFMPIKTMLDERYASDGSWDVDDFNEWLASEEEPVHGIINLNESGVYYRNDKLSPDIKTMHLVHKAVPNIADQNQFYETLAEWQDGVRGAPLRVVIHCTAGSRAGYFIALYLFEITRLSVDEALEAFQKSWPPGHVQKPLTKNLYFFERKKRQNTDTQIDHAAKPSQDRPRERNNERQRDRSRDRPRGRGNERSRERDNERPHHRHERRSQELSRERPRDQNSSRERTRDQNRAHPRDRSRERHHDRSQERQSKQNKNRRARRRPPYRPGF